MERRGNGHYHRRMRQFGRRITGARQVVWDVLHSARGHLSAEEVYLKAQELCPNIGIATVYRALDLFCEMGILNKVVLGDGKARYEVDKGKEHFHIVCTNCGAVEEMADHRIFEELGLLFGRIRKRLRFSPQSFHLQVEGLCDKCRRR